MLLNSRFPRRRRNSDQCRTNLESEPPEGLQVSSNAKVRTSMIESQQQKQRGEPSFAWVLMCASVYVLSGVTQVSMSCYSYRIFCDPSLPLFNFSYVVWAILLHSLDNHSSSTANIDVLRETKRPGRSKMPAVHGERCIDNTPLSFFIIAVIPIRLI